MNTTWRTIEITLPISEVPFIRTLAKKLGWTMTVKREAAKKGLDEGIEDVKAGRVKEVSLNDLRKMMDL